MSLNAATFLGQEPTVLRGQTLAALLPEQWPALQAALPPAAPTPCNTAQRWTGLPPGTFR